MKNTDVRLHAYTRDTVPGVCLQATLVLVDHEDDGDLVETAREAFRTAMATVWATSDTEVHVYTEEEQEAYFLRGD